MGNLLLMGDSTEAWHNLAVEELLFDGFGGEGVAFYLWQNKDTVVIGRHQNAWKECRVKLLEDEGGFLARRSSGGGAVYHDLGNLNFTFILPRRLYDARRQLGVIREAVARFGVRAEFTGRNDLVAADGGAKFSGNAFRFSEAAGLHHGTLMVNVDMDRLGRYLAPDAGKLKAKGIDSVRSRVRNLAEINPGITVPALREALKAAFVRYYLLMKALPGEEALTPREIRLGKALPFDATLSRRFDWGGVTLELSLRHGAVAGAKAYSDAMDEAMIARVAPALTGVKYENEALAAALRALGHPQANELAEWLRQADLGGHQA